MNARCSLADEILRLTGCEDFTILLFDRDKGIATRAFSTRPDSFTCGSTKSIIGASWAEIPMETNGPVFSNDLSAIRETYDDHPYIQSMGYVGIANFPITQCGTCIGIVNCLYLATYSKQLLRLVVSTVDEVALELLKYV